MVPIPKWFLFLQPVGFFIFLTAGIAETNRAPFDFPEAEQELVAGYHTEYSSMALRAVLPGRIHQHGHGLGGGHRPVPRRLAHAAASGRVLGWLGWFLVKRRSCCFFYIWMRWTLPRYRYDQLMAFGWKCRCCRLAVINLLADGGRRAVLGGY